MLEHANRLGRWVPPPSGRFENAEDIEGALVAGTPEDIVASVVKFHEAGCEHIVFDLRFRFSEWLECVQLVGEEVLPRRATHSNSRGREAASISANSDGS